jgi:hypothetical protein
MMEGQNAVRIAGTIASTYGDSILRDAPTNAFREFQPIIAVFVPHRL